MLKDIPPDRLAVAVRTVADGGALLDLPAGPPELP
jgi:hypothetical protein